MVHDGCAFRPPLVSSLPSSPKYKGEKTAWGLPLPPPVGSKNGMCGGVQVVEIWRPYFLTRAA